MNLGTLTAILAVVDNMTPVLHRIEQSVQGGTARMSSMFGKLSTGMQALAGTAVYGAVAAGIGRIVSAADEMDTVAARINDTATNVQRLQAIAEGFDAEMGGIVTAIQTMQAKLGSGELDQTLAVLNLRVEEFRGLSPTGQYVAMAEALGKIPDPASRALLAQDAMGRSAKALAGTFRENVGEARRWVEMQNDTVATLDRLGISWSNAKASLVNFGGEMLMHITQARTLLKVYDRLGQFYDDWIKKADIVSVPSPFKPATSVPGLPADYLQIQADLTKKYDNALKGVAATSSTVVERSSLVADTLRRVRWQDAADRVTALRDSLNRTNDEIREHVSEAGSAADVIHIGVLPATTRWQQALEVLKPSLRDTRDGVRALGSTLRADLIGVLESIPQTIASSLQGGGGLSGAIKSIASQLGSTLGANIGTFFGGPLGGKLGAAVGSLAGPLVGALGNLFGKTTGKQANDLRDQLIASAGGTHALNVAAVAAGASLDALFRARNPEQVQAAWDALNGKLGSHKAQIELAKQAMQEFGIDASQAGQAFKQAEMDETARSITEKLEAMMAVGVSTDAIIAGAGDEIGAFIQRAIEMGTSVPKEWEGIAREMIAAGTLIDKNGDKFTDLAQVPFAQSLNDKIGSVMDKLSAFLDKILDIPDALNRIPRDVEIDFNARWNEDKPPGFRYGSGGIQDFGAGTWAILHGRERVQTEAQMQAEQSAGRGGGVTVHVDARGALVGDYASQMQLADVVSDAVMRRLGLRNQLGMAGAY